MPTGLSPFQLIYGKVCHLPIELEHKAYWALKKLNVDAKAVGERENIKSKNLKR